MKRPLILLISLGIILGFGTALWIYNAAAPTGASVVINGTAVRPVPVLHAESVIQGRAVYGQFCPECHGANSGHTWHHSDEVLLYILAHGGTVFSSSSKMPAYKQTLTEAEMAAVLDFIKSTWGRQEREYQWWMTATRTDAGTLPLP